jgi:hypothetical protein
MAQGNAEMIIDFASPFYRATQSDIKHIVLGRTAGMGTNHSVRLRLAVKQTFSLKDNFIKFLKSLK